MKLNDKKLKEKNKISEKYIILFFAVFSFAVMYICTASSFRYAVNPWNDANAFFTVGKAMANGLVPYKDVFEQKGPLLYGIHALAYLISKTSFTGVYIFESVAAVFTSYFTYKISELYINKILSVLISSLTLVFIVNSYCFYLGDSAEEFVLPMMAASLYFIMKYFKNPTENRLKKSSYFVVGIFVGCTAMIKFTLIGFWFGYMAVLMIYTLTVEKKIKDVIVFVLMFFAGVFAAIAPWIIYLGINGALKDFINIYFVLNSTAYIENKSFLDKTLGVFSSYRKIMGYHPDIIIPSLIGAFLPLFSATFSDGKIFSRIAVPTVYFSTVFFIYFGGKIYTYYALPLTVFVLFDLIFICSFFGKSYKKRAAKITAVSVSAVLIFSTVLYSYFFHGNSRYTVRDINETYNKKVSDYINAHNPDGKILCYGSLDMGVYLLDDYYDVQRHFEYQNFEYEKFPENRDEQNRYIDEHMVDYVVARTEKKYNNVEILYDANSTLRDDYELVLSENFEIISQSNTANTDRYTCYLFELKK